MSDEQTVVSWQAKPHDPAWVAATMQPGPNGVRFDTVDRLEAAAALPTGLVSMYDSVNAWALPTGAAAYAGYYNGTFANLTAIRSRFPNAEIVTVTPNGEHGAMYIDVEPGDARPGDVVAFIKGGGIGFYASPGSSGYTVQECIDALTAAGIHRSAYRVWSAHWIGRHICGPTTCGHPQADGTQYVSTAGWDESVVASPAFFRLAPPPPAPPPPAPKPPPVPVPVWQSWTADGKTTLAEAVVTGVSGQNEASVIAATFAKYGFNTALGSWLNQVFGGAATATAPLPASVVLYRQALPAPPAPKPPPPAAALPAWQTALLARLPDVRLGDVDKAGQVGWVRQVQLLLQANGNTLASVDGDFGPQTKTAVEAWQARAGLLKTGWVDPATWETLVGGKVGALLPTVAEGSSLAGDVKRIQALCNTHGLQVTIDGHFGPATKAAVAAVQKVYYPKDAAKQDGVVGPVTWSLLAAHALP